LKKRYNRLEDEYKDETKKLKHEKSLHLGNEANFLMEQVRETFIYISYSSCQHFITTLEDPSKKRRRRNMYS